MFHLPMTKSGVSRAKLSNRYLHKKLSTPECQLTNSNDLNLTRFFILANDLRWIRRNAQ